MTPRRILLAAGLGAAALGVLAPVASAAGPSVDSKTACAWVYDQGICLSNPLEDLPVQIPSIPKPPLP